MRKLRQEKREAKKRECFKARPTTILAALYYLVIKPLIDIAIALLRP